MKATIPVTPKEKLVVSIQLEALFHPEIIEHICRTGYRETGNKFWISFNGSKGYWDSISIECEGYQKADNSICRSDFFTKNRFIRKRRLNIYYSDKNGVRLSFGSNKARVIEKPKSDDAPVCETDNDDYLPF